jgi:adenosine deaminase CECR1
MSSCQRISSHILAKMTTSFSIPDHFGSVDDYFKARQSFVNAERALGYESRVNSSDLEVRAQKIVQGLKKWEESNHYGVLPDGSGCEAGHRFLHGQDAIEKSKLFKVAHKAPKGSLLHCHFDCILPPRTLLDDAKKQNGLHIKTDCPLTTAGFFTYALPQFCVLPEAVELSDTTNVFSKAYVAGSWMKYSEFLRLFPGGLERAEAWLSKQAVIASEDAYNPRQTVDG